MNKEFKREVDDSFKEMDYVGKKVGVRWAIAVIICVVFFGAIGIGSHWVKVNTDREIFKHSVTYNEGVADFLAKQYREYNKTEDPIEKKAICNYVVERYPNLDIDGIENAELREFYEMCIKGNG